MTENLPPALPHILLDSQPILPVWLAWLLTGAIILAWSALVITIIWLILRRFLQKPQMPSTEPGFAQKFDQNLSKLNQQFLANENYREGMHALSEFMRKFWSETQKVGLHPLTTQEMHGNFETEYPAELFKDLNSWQFSREEPTREDFTAAVNICRNEHKRRIKPKKGAFKTVSSFFSKKPIPAEFTPEASHPLEKLLEKKDNG